MREYVGTSDKFDARDRIDRGWISILFFPAEKNDLPIAGIFQQN